MASARQRFLLYGGQASGSCFKFLERCGDMNESVKIKGTNLARSERTYSCNDRNKAERATRVRE